MVLVRTDDPVLLKQAQDSLGEIISARFVSLPTGGEVSSGVEENDEVGEDGEEGEGATGTGVPSGRLAGILLQAWRDIPPFAQPVLSIVSYAHPFSFCYCVLMLMIFYCMLLVVL